MLAQADTHDRPVSRIASVAAGEALARFADGKLLAEGKVVLISLDAVAERLGAKWALRRDQVFEHADRTLDRMIGPSGYHLRLSSNDYLVCQPEIGRYAGQWNCLRALRDILRHFLGSAHVADSALRSVVKVGTSAIETHPVDTAAIADRCAEEAASQSAPPDAAALSKIWAPFVDGTGRSLRASCVLEPLFELKGFTRIGMRLRQRVRLVGQDSPMSSHEIRELATADIVRIDLATLARGLERLRSESGDARHPTLVLPVSYTTLGSMRGRVQVMALLKEASLLVRQGIICEVSNIEGVPQSALAATLGLLRPLTLYTVGKLRTAAPTALAPLKGAPMRGLCFDLTTAQGDDFITETKASIEAARRVAGAVIAYGARTPQDVAVVAALGATHVSISA